MSPEVHPAAATGFARDVDAYERGRPSFPPDAVAYLVEDLAIGAGRTLLELGAGTGKLTRLLVPTGVRIVAVEPVAAMRTSLASALPEVVVLDGVAEELPLDANEADAAVAAQAFHWFDGSRALAELARVLPVGAPLGLVWNVRDESVPWIAALTDLIEPYRGDTPTHRSQGWREAFDGSAWSMPERRSVPYVHATTREGTVDRILSISFIAALPDADRATVADGVRALLPGDEPDDPVAFAYRTDVWSSRRVR